MCKMLKKLKNKNFFIGMSLTNGQFLPVYELHTFFKISGRPLEGAYKLHTFETSQTPSCGTAHVYTEN